MTTPTRSEGSSWSRCSASATARSHRRRLPSPVMGSEIASSEAVSKAAPRDRVCWTCTTRSCPSMRTSRTGAATSATATAAGAFPAPNTIMIPMTPIRASTRKVHHSGPTRTSVLTPMLAIRAAATRASRANCATVPSASQRQSPTPGAVTPAPTRTATGPRLCHAGSTRTAQS